MLSEIAATIKEQFGNLGAPLHKVARQAQSLIAETTAPSDRAGSVATTRVGQLPTGPRPEAAEIRAAQLPADGKVDHARATRDAERTLASIDFSKPDIVLWVPATGSHSIPSSWQDNVAKTFGDRASLALVDYPANANFNSSVATGQETLKLVLAGIAERDGNHRVSLAGHSQGAWVIGDTIDDPTVGRIVDKAILYGHPAPARVDWSRGLDPRVQQVDDPADPFTWEVVGGRQALDAIAELHEGGSTTGEPLDIGGMISRGLKVASAALLNPGLGAYLIGKHVVADQDRSGNDPHHYAARYGDGAAFLARA
ncbi:MAG: hypothetical protein ABI200_03985 [Gaiellales bacterium]